MTKGCKIWLWFLFAGACLGILSNFALMSYAPGVAMISIVIGIGQLAGVSLMLFKQKKEGFYVQCACAVIMLIVNMSAHISIGVALLSAVVGPAITYYLVIVKNGLSGGVSPIATNNTFNNFGGTTSNATTTSFETSGEMSGTDSNATDGSEAASGTTTYASASNASTAYTAANSGASSTKESATEQKFSADAATVLGGKNMDASVDLYKELEIDRAWDEKAIRNHLKGLQKLWTQRQGATNDKEQLLLIDKVLGFIEQGYRNLTKAIKRQQYDAALEAAYKAGKIFDEAEEKLLNILDQARAYYRKGNIKLATRFAQEAVDGKVNDPAAYDLLARCFFDTDAYEKAINAVDQGLQIFADNINLHWLGARIATVGTKNYDEAQQRVNNLISIAPDKAIGHTEQVYLHLRKGDESLAFQEIDSYIQAHPSDEEYKRNVAYDLDSYSNTCYYHDASSDSYFIADKASYDKCLMLRTKATQIFNDEHTQNQLQNAQYFGQKEWNDWNMPAIKSLAIYGSIFAGLGLFSSSGAFLGLGLVFYAIMGLLIYFSFRPYWQINKTYVTGQMGQMEQVVNQLGDYSAKAAVFMLRALIKIVGLILRFVFGLASGRWF